MQHDCVPQSFCYATNSPDIGTRCLPSSSQILGLFIPLFRAHERWYREALDLKLTQLELKDIIMRAATNQPSVLKVICNCRLLHVVHT